jgi:hypothetical protein
MPGFFASANAMRPCSTSQHRYFSSAPEVLVMRATCPSRSRAIGVFGGCGTQAYLPYNPLTKPNVKSMGLFFAQAHRQRQ